MQQTIALQPRKAVEWPFGAAGEMARRIGAHDWSATPIGPIEHWPQSLRTAVDLMLAMPGPATILWGPEHVQLYNDAYIAIAQDRHPANLGRPVAEGWADALDQTIRPLLQRAARGQSTRLTDVAVLLRSKDGQDEERVFDTDWSPIRDETGEVAGVLQTLTETTDRRRAQFALRANQASQTFLLTLSDRLRLESDPQTIARTAVSLLAKHLGLDRAYVAQVDKARDVAVIGPEYRRADLAPVAGELTLSDFPEAFARVEKATLVLEDIAGDPALSIADKRGFAALQMGAVMVASARKGIANPVWSLLVATEQPRSWTPSEIALVENTAERTWTAIEHARAEAALAVSENKYRLLFDSMDEAFALVEVLKDDEGRWTDFRFLDANPAFMHHTSMPNPIGRTATELLGSPNPRWTQLYGQVLDTGEAIRVEETEHTLDRTFDLYIFRLNREKNQVAILFTDITARNQAEASLRRSEERQAFLLAIGDAMRLHTDPAGKVEAAARLLGERLQASRVLYAEYDWQRNAANVFNGWFKDGSRPFPTLLHLETFEGEVLSHLKAGRTVRVDDVGLRSGDPAYDAIAVIGVQALLSVPLLSEGTLRINLSIHQHEPRAWTDDEVALVQEVAERLWPEVERARAEEALRKSEQRWREFADYSADTLYIVDAETRQLEYLSPAYEEMWGEPRAAVMADLSRWLATVRPEDRTGASEGLPKALTGEGQIIEYRIVRPDGSQRWIRDTAFPIRDAAGCVRRIGGIAQDVTFKNQAEAAIAESEQRLRSLVEGVPQLVWRATGVGKWTWASPQWTRFTGQTEGDSHGLGWLEAVHPEDRPAAMVAWEHAAEQGGFEVAYRLRHIDGRYSWFNTRATPVRGRDGAIVEWLGTSTDIHDLRELQEQQKVLVAELQHRTRNLMAVVRSTADKTIRSSTDLADFRARFRERLDALARVQGLLSRLNEHDRVTFDELIRTELSALTETAERVTLVGPAGLALRSSTVQTLAMALHELATNALKYGALRHSSGHLTVRWSLEVPNEGKPMLHVDWCESGVPMPPQAEAPRRGQGRELIERALPYQLSAVTTYELGSDGVHCTIRVPVSASNKEGAFA